MSNRIENARIYAACYAESALIVPRHLARKVKETAENHPAATAITIGAVVGTVIAPLLVNGDQVHPDSLYAKIFKK